MVAVMRLVELVVATAVDWERGRQHSCQRIKYTTLS